MNRVLSLFLSFILALSVLMSGNVFAKDAETPEACLYASVEIASNGRVESSDEPLFKGSFADVTDYMNYSKSGGIIVLEKNIKLEKNVTLQSVNGTTAYILVQGDGVRFDLNGYVIAQQSGNDESINPVFVVPNNKNLWIQDSSQGKKGIVNGVCGAVTVNGGTVRVDDGTLKAQSQANMDFDDGELVVKVTEKGRFYLSGGTVEFNGKLDDGRTYFGKSCPIYADASSTVEISGASRVFGKIETEEKENLVINGGIFEYDVSEYIPVVMKITKMGDLYSVHYPWPEETRAVFGDVTLPVRIELNVTEDDLLSGIDVYVLSKGGGEVKKEFGTVRFDLSEIFRSIAELCKEEYLPIKISTDAVCECFAQEMYIDAENVGKVIEAANGGSVFLEIEITDNVNNGVLQLARNTKLFAEYRFVDQNGKRLETDAEFKVEISDGQGLDEFELFTLSGKKLCEKEYDYSERITSMTLKDGEKVVFTQGVSVAITGKNLDIEKTISMVFYADIMGVKADRVKMLFWTSPQSKYTVETAERCISYVAKDEKGYRFVYENIPSKEMNKKIYARIVAEDTNGNLIYGDVPTGGFSIVDFAQSMMENPTVKPLLIKMLNYGSAAQEYFETGDEPANLILDEKSRVIDFTPVYKNEAETIEEPTINGKCEAKIAGKTLTLDGNISINYYVIPEKGVDETGVIFWSGSAFDNTEKHIVGTQSKRVSEYSENGKYYVFSYDDVMSYSMSEPVYARVYTKKDGVYRYGDINKYSIKDYVASQIEKKENPKLIKLLRAMMLYGKEAEKFFSSEK